jgi:RP/EB family microtubule-associated protein
VERLIKCRFQGKSYLTIHSDITIYNLYVDNLEFLQWVKKYWDMYYPGGHYDAIARRKSNSASKAVSNPVTLKKTSSNNSSML